MYFYDGSSRVHTSLTKLKIKFRLFWCQISPAYTECVRLYTTILSMIGISIMQLLRIIYIIFWGNYAFHNVQWIHDNLMQWDIVTPHGITYFGHQFVNVYLIHQHQANNIAWYDSDLSSGRSSAKSHDEIAINTLILCCCRLNMSRELVQI